MAGELRNKLFEYRIKKQKQKVLQAFISKFSGFWKFGIGQTSLNGKEHVNTGVIETNINLTKTHELDSNAEITKYGEDALSQTSVVKIERDAIISETSSFDLFRYALYVVIVLFWITLYIIAIKLQFGAVYFMFSALFGIYFNTRTTPKKPNEISAYSVFNKYCESIDGTLKAEQFEREIRYGHFR